MKKEKGLTEPKKAKSSTAKKELSKKIAKPIIPVVTPSKYEDDSSYSLKTAELSFDTEVYDEGDLASALEIGFIAHALELHKAKVAPETHPDFDGESCIDCGEDIPKERLALGRIRCVHCQEILEKKNKLRG